MQKIIDEIREYGVPDESINAFNLEQLKLILLLLEHGRLSAEQIECVAENLKDTIRLGRFTR